MLPGVIALCAQAILGKYWRDRLVGDFRGSAFHLSVIVLGTVAASAGYIL